MNLDADTAAADTGRSCEGRGLDAEGSLTRCDGCSPGCSCDRVFVSRSCWCAEADRGARSAARSDGLCGVKEERVSTDEDLGAVTVTSDRAAGKKLYGAVLTGLASDGARVDDKCVRVESRLTFG